MKYTDKRIDEEDLESVQAGNRRWWTEHTMSYDWKDRAPTKRFTAEWFDEIDRRFIESSRLFAHDESPFDQIIPLQRLRDMKVLEIGCGMGLHSELMTRAGADVIAVDISDTSVNATRTRMGLKGLACDVRKMDASSLEFPDDTFDFVWSWGAIHHSAQTGRIIREIHRVLKPAGETRLMVYNLGGMPAYVMILKRYLFNFWRGESLDHCLWTGTDGYSARFYTEDILVDILGIFFRDVSVASYGQEADAIPLPRSIRKLLLPLLSTQTVSAWANRRGAFLLVNGTK
jgi:2-polyprenyl-3-methyl-5-hydroxy-6-metoxy-1,4-benzoquinol methylase